MVRFNLGSSTLTDIMQKSTADCLLLTDCTQ